MTGGLEKAHPSAIDEIRLTDDRGFTVGRIGFAIELYFQAGEVVARREALVAILRDYHECFDGQITHYLKVNASRSSRITSKAYLDHFSGKAASLSPAAPFDGSVFGYPGGEIVEEPTPVSLSFSAAGPDPLAPLGLSYMSAYFPASFIASQGQAHLVEMTRRWAMALHAVHGCAGYSVLLEQGEFGAGGAAALMPVLKRYPGLDFSDPGMFLVESSDADATSIKSINWLTVLGDDALMRLGGTDAVARQLGVTCPVHSWANGAIVQAGNIPRLGDRDRGIVLSDYRRVAQLVKPIRFSAYKRGLFALGHGEDEREQTRQWLERFD